ncbi:MAG: hypothetical protein Q8L34_03375 [Candidatus Woesearchaeota archaeon]|nr:hypothetical protein [Candidatus Woesearchaeota archaeon]
MLEQIIKQLVQSKADITKKTRKVSADSYPKLRTEFSVKVKDYQVCLEQEARGWYTQGGDFSDAERGTNYTYRIRVIHEEEEIFSKKIGELQTQVFYFRTPAEESPIKIVGRGHNLFERISKRYNAQEKARKKELLKDLMNQALRLKQ